MTRRDYVGIARAIAQTFAHVARYCPDYCEGWHAANSATAHRIADHMAATNKAFDRARFLKACGVQS